MPILFILYPFLVHAAVVSDEVWLEYAAIIALGLIALGGPLLARKLWAWLTVGVFCVGGWWLSTAGYAISFLYLPPVLITGMLFVLFARSLRPGQTPLVGRIAALMRDGHMTTDLKRYSRNVTILWCGVFAFIGLTSVALALWAPKLWWSLFTNFISYGLLALLFLGEYLYRQRFHHDEYELSWKQFIQRMFTVNYREL